MLSPAFTFAPYTLAASVLVLILVLLWMFIRGCRTAGGLKPFAKRILSSLCKWLVPISKCAVLVILVAALLGAGWIAKTELQARRISKKALARWAEIGRPMPEFEKRLTRVEENASLRELVKELKPFGIVTLHRPPYSEDAINFEDPNKIDLPSEIVETLLARHVQSDRFEPPVPKLAYLEQHRENLNRLYEGILHRDRPVWTMDFANTTKSGECPNYLAARQISQLIAADAVYRLANGDSAGAETAVEAGLKMTQNLGEQPIMVSFMIRVAINALFTRQMAWLPEDPNAWERLAKDVETSRTQFVTTLQGEALWGTRALKFDPSGSSWLDPDWCRPFPRWAGKVYAPFFIRLEVAKNSAILAENARVQIRDWNRGDLGQEEMEQKCRGEYSNTLTPNFLRAAYRLNLTLLLREQAEMIRFSRARMQEGKVQAEHPSVVIPGAKWQMIGDAATNSAALKLIPTPRWAVDNNVAGEDFFLLPLDGSKSWKFAPAPEKK